MACILVKEAGLRGKGIDFSKKAIEAANHLKQALELDTHPTFHWVDGKDFTAIKKADLVTCFEVLEHVEDDEALLKKLLTLSNKYVMVSVPAKQKLYSRSDELAGHFRRYEKYNLTNLLEKNGLKIVSFVSYGYPYTNLVRLAREQLSRQKKHKNNKQTMEQRSKKSGYDLLDLNKYLPDMEKLIMPFYKTSRLFNDYDLSEGYLVLCQKSK